MRTLWVESYRPDNVSDYVFKDDAQREQVLAWIKTGALPQLLFSGSAGTGKCLAGTELVDVMIDTSTLSEDQRVKLEQYRIK